MAPEPKKPSAQADKPLPNNGIPPGADEEDAKGLPGDRQANETAATPP